MNFNNYDMLYVDDEKQRQYFLGFHSTAGYVLITKDTKIFVVDSRYYHSAKNFLEPKGITVIEGAGHEILKQKIAELKIKKMGIDYTNTSLSNFNNMLKLGVNLIDASRDLEKTMTIKRDDEIALIKKACEIAEQSFLDVLKFVKVGVTEREIANELEYLFKKYGASKTSFDTIVAFGENASVPHHETSDRKLKNNECILMDFGCVYSGYCSDMTRTFFFGEPDAEFERCYKSVLNAHMMAYNNIKDNDDCILCDGYARAVLANDNLDKYFTHSLGHGIGVNIHEYPGISFKSSAVMKNGMVFSIEPGVYFSGKFGIRIEDTCVLENGKVKSLMTVSKDLLIIK